MLPEVRHSVCALDCPDTCGLLINVENGIGSKLRGDPATPSPWLPLRQSRTLPGSRIFSPKAALSDAPHRSERRRHALSGSPGTEQSTRSPTRLKAIGEEFGSESILPYSYAGTMGMLNGSGMDRRFFHKLGASRLDRTICSPPEPRSEARVSEPATGWSPSSFATRSSSSRGERMSSARTSISGPSSWRPPQWRPVLCHRSGRKPDGQAGGQSIPDSSRQRSRPRPGD